LIDFFAFSCCAAWNIFPHQPWVVLFNFCCLLFPFSPWAIHFLPCGGLYPPFFHFVHFTDVSFSDPLPRFFGRLVSIPCPGFVPPPRFLIFILHLRNVFAQASSFFIFIRCPQPPFFFSCRLWSSVRWCPYCSPRLSFSEGHGFFPLPSSEETRSLVLAGHLSCFKPGFFLARFPLFVLVSRRGVFVDEIAPTFFYPGCFFDFLLFFPLLVLRSHRFAPSPSALFFLSCCLTCVGQTFKPGFALWASLRVAFLPVFPPFFFCDFFFFFFPFPHGFCLKRRPQAHRRLFLSLFLCVSVFPPFVFPQCLLFRVIRLSRFHLSFLLLLHFFPFFVTFSPNIPSVGVVFDTWHPPPNPHEIFSLLTCSAACVILVLVFLI